MKETWKIGFTSRKGLRLPTEKTSRTSFRARQRTQIKYIEILAFNRKTEETSRTDRTEEEKTVRKATQEAERPQKLVVQVPWKVKSIRKSRINFKQRVLRDKRNQNSKFMLDQVWKKDQEQRKL